MTPTSVATTLHMLQILTTADCPLGVEGGEVGWGWGVCVCGRWTSTQPLEILFFLYKSETDMNTLDS